MIPELKFSFRIDIIVDKPIVVSNSITHGKRQLIPIISGKVSGALEGEVLPGGIDSQIIQPDGICRLSARYALKTQQGTVYIENNGIRRLPEAFKDHLFGSDMSFFNTIPMADIYFRTVPTFEVDSPNLRWLTDSIFICSAARTASGVNLTFFAVL